MENIYIIRSFGILYRRYVSYISAKVETMNLSFSDSVFLTIIGQEEGLSQDDLAKTLFIDKSAVARSMKIMNQKSYINIERDDNDKRKKRLFLTKDGIERFELIQKYNNEWLNKLLSSYKQEEVAFFSKMLRNISSLVK